MNHAELIFLKLGGSLITDKAKPCTPHLDVIQSVSAEIAQITRENPGLKLLVGHGSGSFGHSVAARYKTQSGVEGQTEWHGFAEVWSAARQLNQIVIEHLAAEGLPVIAFPPSAGVIAANRSLQSWDLAPLVAALAHNLIPVVYGDVIFDQNIGGTIFSTEEIFHYLAILLHPRRILLVGSDPGVYHDSQHPEEIFKRISSQNLSQVLPALSGAENPDVTGGMASKVRLMADLVQECPDIEVLIFSGSQPGNIHKAIMGENPGTLITN